MRMKPLALVVGCLAFALQMFVFGNQDDAESHLRVFYSDILSANFAAARQNIDEAIQLWPDNGRYYGWRAYCESQVLPSQCPDTRHSGTGLGRADREVARQAIEDYRKALSLNSRDAVTLHNLAWVENLLGDDSAAARNSKLAIVIDPSEAVFHLSYGMFLEKSGQAGAADQQYERAIELSPAVLDSPFFEDYEVRNPQAANSLVERSARLDEARLDRLGDPILEAKLGKYYLCLGKLLRAELLLEDAARRLPNLPLVWVNLGKVREQQADPDRAIACYRKASAIDRSLPEPYLRMGLIELNRGERIVAARDLHMAVELWERVDPVTAAHNNRLYVGQVQRIDDLLPTTLVWYVTPCPASAAWRGLSELSPNDDRYGRRVNTCREVPSPYVELTSIKGK